MSAKPNNKEFYLGMAVVLGAIARDHGLPSIAINIMKSNGVSFQALKNAGVEPFDLDPLRLEWYSTFRYGNWKRKI